MRKFCQQLLRLIPTPVTHEVIESRPARRMQRRRQQQHGAGRRYPRDLRKCCIVIIHMFDDVERAHQVEHAVGERQRGHEAQQYVSAPRAQGLERRHADIDKLRSLER